MDFAFDLKLYRDNYSEEAGRAAFTYYVTILNNPLVNLMTCVALVGTHLFSFYGWTFNIITHTKAETNMSLAFRNIFFQYMTGTIIYMILVMPRYFVFIDSFRDADNQDLTFSPSLVSHLCLLLLTMFWFFSFANLFVYYLLLLGARLGPCNRWSCGHDPPESQCYDYVIQVAHFVDVGKA